MHLYLGISKAMTKVLNYLRELIWIWVKFRNGAISAFNIRAIRAFLLSLTVICKFLGQFHKLEVYWLKTRTINFG